MEQKTILITGAGSGLGKGTALGLAKQGYNVIAGIQSWEQMSRFQEEIKNKDFSKKLNIIKLDILDEMDCLHAWQYDIDILVSNAGIGHSGPVFEMSVELIREVLETNVFSALEFAQPFIKRMIEKKAGKLVFVSSLAGLTTSPYIGAYNASKYALEAIVQSLRDELVPHGIHVSTINPGPFKTGFNDRMYDTYKQWHRKNVHISKKQDIEEAAKGLLNKQLNPKNMIDFMVDLIPQETHAFRNIFPKALVKQCKEYQSRQYVLNSNEVDSSKK